MSGIEALVAHIYTTTSEIQSKADGISDRVDKTEGSVRDLGEVLNRITVQVETNADMADDELFGEED